MLKVAQYHEDLLQAQQTFVTAALSSPMPGQVRLRLYDAGQVKWVTTSNECADFANWTFMSGRESQGSPAGDGSGVPYMFRPGSILRRVHRNLPLQFDGLALTGSASNLDLSKLSGTYTAHATCHDSVCSGAVEILEDTDHLKLAASSQMIYGSGSTGVRLVAHAAGASFANLSEALGRTVEHTSLAFQATVLASADEGVWARLVTV